METKLGIDHTKKVLKEVEDLAVAGIKLAKHGVGLGSLKQIWELVESAKQLVVESQQAFPELKDIDSQEAGLLATACYDLVKNIVGAVVTA